MTLTSVFILPSLMAGIFLSQYIDLSALIPFVITVTIIGSIWDVWASRHGKKDRVWIWQFNKKETLGFKFLGLPFEEYLFYVASSVYVVFMWEGIKLVTNTPFLNAYFILFGLGSWTMLSILVPYWIGPRGDRFIN